MRIVSVTARPPTDGLSEPRRFFVVFVDELSSSSFPSLPHPVVISSFFCRVLWCGQSSQS
jgi:hypothetical protein